MNVRNHDLALRMAELAQVISLRRVDDVLVDVTAAAKELIAGVDIAGVLLVGKDGTHPLVTRAAVWQREGNRDQPSLHGSQERRDVVEALRSQDHCPVSDRRMTAELACHIQCSAG